MLFWVTGVNRGWVNLLTKGCCLLLPPTEGHNWLAAQLEKVGLTFGLLVNLGGFAC